MHDTKHTARNILLLVNAIIVSGAFLLKIADPIVVNYTEEIRKADFLNFTVFSPVIMVILTLLLRRQLAPLVRLSALGAALDREQAQELRSAAFSLPLRVLFLFNAVILSIVALVALGFDAAYFPFYPLYKRIISMGLIWSYTVCSSLAVYVYVKRSMVPILRSTSGLAADKGPRTSIKTIMVTATITLSAMIFLFLSVYGYSKTREALIDDDEEAASALLYSVKQDVSSLSDLDSLKSYLASRATGAPVYLVDKNGSYLAGPTAAAAAQHRTIMKLESLDTPFKGYSLATAFRTGQRQLGIMRDMTLFFLVIGVFFLLFAGAISYSVAGETSFALTDIEKRMKRIAENKESLFREFESISLDEVGDLTRSFNNLQRAIRSSHEELDREKKKSDELLLNILPAETAEELKRHGKAKVKKFGSVTIMFTDFKDFTLISGRMSPEDLVDEIDSCFRAFDEIIGKYGIEKIKTIGDAYMCVGGLPVENGTHPVDVVRAGIEIRDFMAGRQARKAGERRPFFELRIGIHTGPVVAGVVGLKKFAYDIWGDSVNTAARMESAGEAGKVNISRSTYELVADRFRCIHRGKIEAKNKGQLEMYFVEEQVGKRV
jgi:class 3 adenylate cyclase